MANVILDLEDKIEDRLCTVSAILDVAKVLSALQRMPACRPSIDSCWTGEGSANGYELVADALPTLLNHGRVLVDELRAEASVTLEEFRTKEGANHGQ